MSRFAEGRPTGDSIVASGWLGVFLAALWYCHPPMALLTGMVAGAIAAAGAAVRGPSIRTAACAVAAMAAFAAVATPYFESMSELARSEEPRLANVGMPIAGLGLCLFAMAGFLRSRRLPWLSLWNSGPAHESVQLYVIRYGPHSLDSPGPDPYWLMYLTPYDPARAPIELRSLTPLEMRVDAPTAGYIETFRSWIPGYRVYVDGREQQVHSSRNALVSVRVAPGRHELWVRFAVTVRLHTSIRWAMAAWLIAAVAAAAGLLQMARRPA
jgi:hypothetical protein